MIDRYPPTIIKNIATRNDLLRTEQNLSMRDLAKKSGISKSQLSDIILGNKIQNAYTLYLICTALGISLSDFFDFEDTVIKLSGKEALLVKIYRELSPMSQDTLIKVAKCIKWTSKQKAAIAACQSRFDSGYSYKINPTAFSTPENFPKHSVNFR